MVLESRNLAMENYHALTLYFFLWILYVCLLVLERELEPRNLAMETTMPDSIAFAIDLMGSCMF